MNLNKVFLIGNLTRDPELRSLPSGAPVASFGLATNRIWKNQQGEKQQEVQFHNIVVFGKQADLVKQYLAKGRMAFIEGRIQNRSWDAPDGTKKNRTEIIAERIQFGPRTGTGIGNNNVSGFAGGKFESIESVKEELPSIDINEEDIKADDLPF